MLKGALHPIWQGQIEWIIFCLQMCKAGKKKMKIHVPLTEAENVDRQIIS